MYFAATSIDTIYEDNKVCIEQVEQAKSNGFNLLRWQLIQGSKAPNFQAYSDYINFIYYSLDKYDKCKEKIEEAGLKVSFVMMNPYGGYSGKKMNLFYDTKNQQRNFDGFIMSWEYIAMRYKNDNTVVAYELLNEPQVKSSRITAYLDLMQNTANSIRSIEHKYNQKIIIVNAIGTTPEGFKNMRPIDGDNIYYGFHLYEPSDITHQKKGGRKKYKSNRSKIESYLKYALRFSTRYLKPVVNTEFACNRHNKSNQLQYMKDVLDVFNDYGISYIWHQIYYKEYNVWGLDTENEQEIKKYNNKFLGNYK